MLTQLSVCMDSLSHFYWPYFHSIPMNVVNLWYALLTYFPIFEKAKYMCGKNETDETILI